MCRLVPVCRTKLAAGTNATALTGLRYPRAQPVRPKEYARSRRLPELREIKAALFDLDDTLLDRKSAYNAFYRSFYDRHEVINEDVSWPEAKEFFWSLSPNNATDPRAALLAIKQRWPGVTGDPESHYNDYFKGIVSHMRPLPGAIEFIDAMNASGIPWGVVTNGSHYQVEKVRVAGLEDAVPFVIATELHGANKPARIAAAGVGRVTGRLGAVCRRQPAHRHHRRTRRWDADCVDTDGSCLPVRSACSVHSDRRGAGTARGVGTVAFRRRTYAYSRECARGLIRSNLGTGVTRP